MHSSRWSRVLFVLLCGGTVLQANGCDTTSLTSTLSSLIVEIVVSTLLGTVT